MMHKSLLLTLCLLLALAGCDGGKELNDENFADFWIESYNAETASEERAVEEKYGWSERELEDYLTALSADRARSKKVVDLVRPRDAEAASALELALGIVGGLGDLSELDFSGLGEELATGFSAFGDLLGEALGGLTVGLEEMAAGIERGLAGAVETEDEEAAE